MSNTPDSNLHVTSHYLAGKQQQPGKPHNGYICDVLGCVLPTQRLAGGVKVAWAKPREASVWASPAAYCRRHIAYKAVNNTE